MHHPLLIAAALTWLVSPGLARAADDCHVSVYRLADGRVVEVGPSVAAPLRWLSFDGQTGALRPAADGKWSSTQGWTDKPDGHTVGFSDCSDGAIDFDGVRGRRIELSVTDSMFVRGDVRLAGRLVLPARRARVPIVVLVHGSEHYSGRDGYALQRLLPAAGIGVFVYDKRGTGASTGTYTQDFDVLADDAVAALAEARRLAGSRAGRAGFAGGSQGGWVAPLAATRTRSDFVIVGFGLAVSPLEEDREEVALDMKLKGHDATEIAEALEIADAAGEVMASNFTSGFARFDAVRAKYRDASWYKDIGGDFTGEMLPYDEAGLRAKAKDFLEGAPMHYDAMRVLRGLKIPQLWQLGGRDTEAPSAETARRLKGLKGEGYPISLAMFPHAQHGIYEFVTGSDGEWVPTRNSDGYFAMMRDFILGRPLIGPYGESILSQ